MSSEFKDHLRDIEGVLCPYCNKTTHLALYEGWVYCKQCGTGASFYLSDVHVWTAGNHEIYEYFAAAAKFNEADPFGYKRCLSDLRNLYDVSSAFAEFVIEYKPEPRPLSQILDYANAGMAFIWVFWLLLRWGII